MTSINERVKRLERQDIGNSLELTVSTREPGEPKYFKTVNGETDEISEGEYIKQTQKAGRPVEIIFQFADKPEVI